MDFVDILKWVGIVLAAGFIGYFGRYLAMFIIGRVQKKKAPETPAAEPAKETPLNITPESARLEARKQKAKIEKKKAKARAKKAKKARK